MASDDAFAFVDELLSFFASDAEDDVNDDDHCQQQHLEVEDAESREAAADTTIESGDDDALRFLPTLPSESLSAEEVAEMLRVVGDDDNEQVAGENHQGLHVVLEQTQQQQRAVRGENMPVKKPKKTFRNYNPNRARNGRKEEIAVLRMTAQELGSRLSVLRKKVTKRDGYIPATTTDASSSSTGLQQHHLGKEPSNRSLVGKNGALQQHSELVKVWREVACHQREGRHKSERQNLRLRVVLENQLKVARSLEKFLLLKAAATKEIHKCVGMQQPNRPQFAFSNHLSHAHHPGEAALFQDLLVGVAQSIADVDAIFEENGLAHMDANQVNAQVRLVPEKGGLLAEVCATKVLPFAIRETGEAVWNHCTFAKQRMPSRHYSYSHKSIDATEDTAVEDFTLELHIQNTSASFRVRQIVRRVIEDERVVIVWHSFSDPIEFSKQKLSGLRLLVKGYTVVRKAPSSVPGGSSWTLVQSCSVISRESCREGAGVVLGADDAVVGEITNFTLCETTNLVVDRHQMVENALMEQALKRGSSSVTSCS